MDNGQLQFYHDETEAVLLIELDIKQKKIVSKHIQNKLYNLLKDTSNINVARTIIKTSTSELEKIIEAEKKSGRKEGSVKLMAVSKFHPSDAVIEAFNAGQLLFGENRVQ